MLEFEEDPDYDFLINLFKDALDECNIDEPDFDWNKNLKLERPDTFVYSKYNQKSMLINQKSNLSHLIKGNETSYSPGLMKSNQFQSGFLKPEE